MDEYHTDITPGFIRFHQLCEPPLETGEYSVEVEQSVNTLSDDPVFKGKFQSNLNFFVAGPRFSMNPSEIYSVYPPKGGIGDFANSLPHIVFTRRTLPWERMCFLGGNPKSVRLPWMALLVLSPDDFLPTGEFPEVKARTVGELINPPDAREFVGPKLNLTRYESEKEQCNTIDLPWDLFQAIAPSEADLAYLAHVREVNTDHKETLSYLTDGWFSVVLANRFPQPQTDKDESAQPTENRAYLVSLDGMNEFLPGNCNTANPMRKVVRLAVLSNWSFNCSEAFSFKSSLNKLDVNHLLRIPFLDCPESGDASTREVVKTAFNLGYAALNHVTRFGEATVSWYRGPLVPLYIPKETKYSFLPAADGAMRYDPTIGMFDVTYASAFQLGRLLALQDRHFSTTLQAYRCNVQCQINHVLSKINTMSMLNVTDNGEATAQEFMKRYLTTLNTDSCAVSPDKSKHFSIDELGRAEQTDKQLKLTSNFNLKIPGNLCRWLARLTLLYRIPFAYLVPDERMLPSDSLRFFYLDPSWLKCLLEGACSVGRTSSHDQLVDEHLRDNFLKLAIEESHTVRTRDPKPTVDFDATNTSSDGPDWSILSGFIMRSPIVKGWQGLEMRAWEYNGGTITDLTPLRIDRLGPDIILCIFKGKVERIELKQPPEGMHFGAAPRNDGGFEKVNLRRLYTDNNGGAEAGDQLKQDFPMSIPLRNVKSHRVVDISNLALKLKKQVSVNNEFTSAGFGVEMVESPGRAIFDVNTPNESDQI
jgi:hypothetical protein